MSGRDEPVAAFFPSIDRNLILDLDRHLRGNKALQPAAPPESVAVVPPPPASAALRPTGRPNIASVVGAVEQAAQAITAMTGRIDELESHIGELESVNRQLETQLGEADQAMQSLEGRLRAEGERALRSEGAATKEASRAHDLERELSAVHADLARVTEAITAALGLPDH